MFTFIEVRTMDFWHFNNFRVDVISTIKITRDVKKVWSVGVISETGGSVTIISVNQKEC